MDSIFQFFFQLCNHSSLAVSKMEFNSQYRIAKSFTVSREISVTLTDRKDKRLETDPTVEKGAKTLNAW